MKVLIEIFTQDVVPKKQLVEYTVLEKYENECVLTIPDQYSDLMAACEGKPTLFNSTQIRGFIE
jgi:hypothetical protein